ncbi:MAG: xanthine dehydrogenase family protein molybdopterin-binding subunit [Sphingomonadales bacterium]|nr:xanthine dehydrogenase family protein molybdopterin-binding subunit [Sphingomonadales bacterium]
MSAPPYKVVGTRPVRPDGVDKVTGKAVFGPDFAASGMLHGAVLRSPHPHARIRAIDTSKAAALPGVRAVVTGADFPTLESLTMALGESSGDVLDIARNCMALDKALYEGHAVAAVAATSTLIAREALQLIAVDYEVLPHVIGIEEAMAADAPVLHDTLFTKGLDATPDKPSNVATRFVMANGDVESALAGAAAVASGRFTTAPVHQGYIEPHACVASVNADGQTQIWASSQGAFMIRSLTATILGMPISDIRVTPLEIGGGFGGKTTVYLEPVAVLLSRKCGLPVRLVMTRDEVFRASGPAPGSVVDLRIGADKDGKLVAADIEFRNSAGAFPGSSVHATAMCSLACYRIANFRVTGWDVVSNMPSSAAYRAPGAPPVVFAVESALDEIAMQLGLDPIDLRLRNAVRPGDPGPMGMPHGPVALVECLEAAKAHPHWTAPLAPRHGRGVAAGFWPNYGGQSTATVSVAEDGTITVVTGSPDIGGSRASMAMMAAEVLGLPYEAVRCIVADTASIGFSMVTGGSRTTFATGKAVVEASEAVVATLRARAAAIWGIEDDAVTWQGGAAQAAGQEPLTIKAIAAKAGQSAGGTIAAEATVNPLDYAAGLAVHICDTEVDPETRQVRVARYTAVQDVGRAIHPSYVEGQMQGGAVQGIGWALNEGYVHDAGGRVANAGFLDYRMPVASDLPMIDTVMIEVPNPAHPFGVKGVGEAPIVPPLGAVANAVSRAAGVRLRDLPMSPDRVHAAIAAKG